VQRNSGGDHCSSDHRCELGWMPPLNPALYLARLRLAFGSLRGIEAAAARTVRPCPVCRPDLAERWAAGLYMPSERLHTAAA
jgi:hypothetical protein